MMTKITLKHVLFSISLGLVLSYVAALPAILALQAQPDSVEISHTDNKPAVNQF
ncbi:hypothetical protein [Glaesserella sp.]|uniref:hypothetical protein n=1 Tax=Glaesserella sp. TaxID=2094731 RepID=UPI0035A19DE0